MLFGTESDTDSDALNDSCDNCPTVANGPYDPPPYGKQANSDSIPLTFTGWSNADLDHGAATVYTDHTIPTSGLATHPLGSDWKTWDDWQGDACQDDADRDGLTNTQETSGSACNGFTSNPQLMNSNQGGDPTKPINLDIDGWECRSTVPKDVTSPTDTAYPPQGMTDSDGDGIPDILEMQKYGTDPNNADTDGDGLSDGVEIFDVTGNGVVDGADGWSVCAAMHGKIQYSVNLDLDKNGVINSVDMQWMNTRLGANAVNCPP
jgi:hypothetical protein